MTHTVAYNIELGMVETRAEANLTFDEAKELISEITEIAIAKDVFFVSQ